LKAGGDRLDGRSDWLTVGVGNRCRREPSGLSIYLKPQGASLSISLPARLIFGWGDFIRARSFDFGGALSRGAGARIDPVRALRH